MTKTLMAAAAALALTAGAASAQCAGKNYTAMTTPPSAPITVAEAPAPAPIVVNR